MSEFIKASIKKNKPHFLKYKKYIDDNDWRTISAKEASENAKGKPKSTVDLRKEEFSIQNDLVKAIIERLKVFVKKSEGDHHIKIFKDFIKDTLKIINAHTSRADEYTSDSDIAGIKDGDLRAEEVSFHNDLFKAVSSIDDAVLSLNVREDTSETSGIEFYSNMKCPLSMHETITGGKTPLYPEVVRKLEQLKIDFDSEPNSEFHILNENSPKWNSEKHYWEQEKETLQYYVNEFKKFRRGITIDGYYISGALYYQINAFVTPIPTVTLNKNSGIYESEDIIKNPPLRDNEVYISESYNLAEKEGVMLFLAATRRAAKTTYIASHLDHAATIGKKTLLCAGTSSKDLGQIAKAFKISISNKNAAFAIFNVANDWKDKIEIGIKTKNNKTLLLSTLNIINLEQNKSNKEEVLAGFTPDVFVLDEVMKGTFIENLEALKPALNGSINPATGRPIKRTTVILSGTGGSESLSKDGLQVLTFPKENEILEMNWGLLERGVPQEAITWEEDRQKPFGTFLPGQMSIGMPRIETTLDKYLGIKDAKYLCKIAISVTDWVKAKEILEEKRNAKKGNKATYTKEIVYLPMKPSEIFMSGKESPFPVDEAKFHKQYLLETGLWDRRRNLFRDSNGKIKVELSTKELAPFPHKGGNIDAPYLIFEDPPTEKVKYGTYTAGFDDYKHDDSESSSVATFYIWKNEFLGDVFSNKLVASLSFKPERHSKVHDHWLLLMEAYQLDRTCFGENEDFTIKDYLDRRGFTEKYLAAGIDFTKTFTLSNNLKRTFGWTPQSSKRLLFKLFVDYCNEEFEVEDDKSNKIVLKGVQRIDDIGLLDEVINWNENTNVDRITAAMGAVGYGHYLRSSYAWVAPQKRLETEIKNKPLERQKSFYSTQQRPKSFLRTR